MADKVTARRAERVLLGLIGAPIGHSASPAMHEAAARAAGLEAHYHLIEVNGAGHDDLVAMLDGVRRLGFAGVNVTYPYKEAVLPLLDTLGPEAAAMGAVNTVVARDGKLTGHNTDVTGFRAAHAALDLPANDLPVAIIGAGGVGKAIALALADASVPGLVVFDTDPARAEALAALIGSRATVRLATSVAEATAEVAGIVNGTPLGMLPNRDLPVPADLIRPEHWVADAVYYPLWTPLLLAARKAGARVMTGRDFNIRQALDAFRLFTGIEPSYAAMEAAFDRVVAARQDRERAA